MPVGSPPLLLGNRASLDLVVIDDESSSVAQRSGKRHRGRRDGAGLEQ